MENTMASIFDEVNGVLMGYHAKLVLIKREVFVFLPKDSFKSVKKILEQVGLVIDGNKTNYTISNDVCYKVKILPDAVKHNFKLTNDTNGHIKIEFKKTAENSGYYYFGQRPQSEIEEIMLLFIELNLIGFSDEEICKLFERKFRRK